MPAEGARKPESMCRSVLLPAPFGPSRPVIPGETLNEMPFTATTFPYQRETSSRTIVGVVTAAHVDTLTNRRSVAASATAIVARAARR